MEGHYSVLDDSYPASFLSSSANKPFEHLPIFSRDVLSGCIRRFCKSIPTDCRTKINYINIIQSDFAQRMNTLVQASTAVLCQSSSSSASTPQLLLICEAIHNQYGNTVRCQLLCSSTRWNPPEVPENGISKPAWFETPVTQC